MSLNMKSYHKEIKKKIKLHKSKGSEKNIYFLDKNDSIETVNLVRPRQQYSRHSFQVVTLSQLLPTSV